MNAIDLIHRASASGVELYLEDDQLKYRARGAPLTPDLRDALKHHKAELVAFLRRQQHREATLPECRPELHETPSPLTEAQSTLFYLYKLAGPSSEYTMATAWRFESTLDAVALDSAVRALARRHPVLRSHFVLGDDGQPLQCPQPGETVAVERHRLSAEDSLDETLAQCARSPFILETERPFRVMLFEPPTGGSVLLFLIHHIAFDGASYRVLHRELSDLMRGVALPEPALQVSDLARWQADRPDRGTSDASLQYWREQLEGVQAFNGLPSDRTRLPGQPYEPASMSVPLGQALSAQVRELAHRQGVTVFACLHAALATVVAQWTGRPEAVIGTPVSSRLDHRVEDAIGLFINTAPIRTRLHDTDTVADCLHRVHRDVRQAVARSVPLERLVAEHVSSRDPAFPPMVQILFSLNDATAAPSLELGGLTGTAVSIPRENITAELELTVWDTPDELILDWGYAGNLFDTPTIETLSDALGLQLTLWVEQPDARLIDLPVCSPASQRVIDAAGSSPEPVPSDDTFLHRFLTQVASRPDAIACLGDWGQWTYRELDALSTRHAHRLVSHGVTPGDAVGLYVMPGPDLILGILSILKARATYVPLDPTFPRARLNAIIEASRPRQVLGREVPDELGARLSLADPVDDQASTPLPLPRRDDRAYLMFTSGTTGTPKGVEIDHANLEQCLAGLNRSTPLQPGDRMPQLTAASFDVHVVEVQHVLASGATVVTLPEAARRDPHALADYWQQYAVNHAHATPATWQMLVDAGWRSPVPMTLYSGGDALSVSLKDRLLASHPGHRLWNYYGPTEATVYLTADAIERHDRRITIGRPFPNQGVDVLDRHGRRQPLGVPGELYLTGTQLARGYLNQPTLTAERFPVDPVSGTRRYRTGDLARYRPDGRVEVLGRLDFQVKVNGHRVELAEIELALTEDAEVDAAVVVLTPLGEDHHQLVGFVTATPDAHTPALTERLIRTVRDRLPGYMVPHRIEVLDQLPLTANQKIDRRALENRAGRVASGTGGRAPEGELEGALADIWSALLGFRPVDAHRSFFELGGHSLLAVKLLAQVESRLGVRLTLQAMLASPSIAALATLIERHRNDADVPESDTNRPGTSTPPYQADEAPATEAQRSLWTLDTVNTQGEHYTLPIKLEVIGPLDVTRLENALERLVARHEALRARFVLVDGVLIQRFDATDAPVLSIYDHTDPETRAPDAVEGAVFAAPFDLESGPLFRAALSILGDQRHTLYLAAHHIVMDGGSASVLMHDLKTLYDAQDARLPELTMSFADVCRRLDDQTTERVTLDALSFWRSYLADAPVVHNLPLDRPRPARATFAGSTVTGTLSRSTASRLNALAHTHGTTVFTLVYASLALLLARHSGQDDWVIGTPVANRPDPAMNDLVGYFANIVPLRTRIQWTDTFGDYLQHCHHALFSAFEHQQVPFDRIVEAVNPPRSLSHAPVFQTLVTVDTAAPGPQQLGEARMVEGSAGAMSAKYDLALSVSLEQDGWGLHWTYATDLFDEHTVRRWNHQLTILMNALADDDQWLLADIPMMTEADRRQLLDLGRGPSLDYDPTFTCLDRFEGWVRRQPESIAVEDGSDRVSYVELNQRAEHSAHTLKDRLEPGDAPLVLCMPRSVGFIQAQLAAMKTGRPFVGIDPATPRGRLTRILDELKPAAVIIQRDAPDGIDPTIPILDVNAPTPTGASEPMPRPALEPDATAYLVYTSGSTGHPKGVMGTHRGLVNMALPKQQRFGLGPDTRMTVSANVAFDSVLWEIWPTLISGGTLVINPDAVLRDPVALEAHLHRSRPTHLWLPTGLMETVGPLIHWPESLRHVFTGGDRLGGYCLPKAVSVEFHNIYGPSECSIWASCHPVVATESGPPPVGRPLPNVSITVRDADHRLLPPGAVGEICIGGEGVGRGYFARPDLTQSAFIETRDEHGQPSRIYRTGDVGRWRPDGTLDCLGRRDSQVKIRGYRVELDDINRHLLAQAGIAQAFTHVREQANEKHLVSFVVLQTPESDATADQWLEQLSYDLPRYMMPTAIHRLDQLPLTPNGKVDRRQLDRWLDDQPVSDRVNTASPRDQLELTLYDIWRSVLLTPHIGIDTPFFEAGGSSIAAIKVIAAINDTLGTRLAPSDLLLHPTIEQLAGRIRTREGQRLSASHRVDLSPGNGEAHLVCVHPAGGTAFCYLSLARCLPDEISVVGLQAPGVSPGDAFLPDLTQMAEHHLASIAPLLDRPVVLTGASFGGLLGFEMLRLLHERGHRRVSLVMLDTEGSDDEQQLAQLQPVSAEVFREKLIRYNGMYPGIEDAQIEQYHRLYNHHVDVQRRYRAGDNGGRVVLIQATGDTTAEQRHDGADYWRRHVSGDLIIEASPGTHASMLESPAVDHVADLITREFKCLNRPSQPKEPRYEPS